MSKLVEAKVEHRFRHAGAEEVYDAWLDENDLRSWMREALTTFGLAADIRRIETDAREGGCFVFSDMRDGDEARHWGTYRRLERPRLIEFTWFTSEEEEREDLSVVRIEITPQPVGCTAVLTHSMDAAYEDYLEQTARGWKTMLDAIEATHSRP